jgi:BirA family biotin operon repressor/biotin-[acetyl-CoA-carboxylase] ligase
LHVFYAASRARWKVYPVFRAKVATELKLQPLLEQTFLASAELHEEIGSTNDRARLLGAVDLPCLIAAEQQTAGRGRGNNRWWTGQGSLAFSVLLDASAAGIPREHTGLVSLAAAAAVVKGVQPLAAGHSLGLHWPNDVYAGGRKLAGILVESLPGSRLVIGIGLNANNSLSAAPREVRELAVALCELTGGPHDRTQLLIDVLNQLQAELAALAKDPETIGLQADALCLQRGDWLTIDTGRETVEGRCFGIEADGALVLLTATGPRKFYAGVLCRP